MKLKNVLSILAMLMIVFLAGCKKDETPGMPPTVTLTDPANLTTGVTLNHLIVITFSEPMDESTITSLNLTLKQGATSVSGAVTYTGSTATFTPANNMEPSKVYTGTITTGAQNMAGDAMAVEYTFSFTTGLAPDIILPLVSSTNPLNIATGVSRDKIVSITFSEAMNPTTINSSTFTLMQGETAVPGTVASSGTTATFTPTNVLLAGSEFTATVSTGATDAAGNALETSKIWSFTTGGTASALAAVNLGTAGSYVILAKSGISTTGTTLVTGNMGISPAEATFITGFGLILPAGGAFSTSSLVVGNVYAPSYAAPTPVNLTTAVGDMELAYTDAAGRTLPDYTELYTGNLGGKTLSPGLYKWTNTVTLPSSVTISGSSTDVWIFQIAGDLTVSSAVNVNLIGGALPENIFWQVAGQATIGTTAQFKGIILSMTGITFQTGASMNGRLLAQTAVILDANPVTQP